MLLDEGAEIFYTESVELLEDMEVALLDLERNPNDQELINRIFRAAHTIKGSAGLFGYDDVISFTHVAENLLDDVRNCLVPVNGELSSLLMQSKDYITQLVEGLVSGNKPDTQRGEQLVAALNNMRAGGSDSAQDAAGGINAELEPSPGETRARCWHLSIRLGPDTFRQGFSPVSIFVQLEELGRLVDVLPVTVTLPSPDELDPEQCYLGWKIALESEACEAEILAVFDFFEDIRVGLLGPEATPEQWRNHLQNLPEPADQLGRMAVQLGSLSEQQLADILTPENASAQTQAAAQPEVATPSEVVDASPAVAAVSAPQGGGANDGAVMSSAASSSSGASAASGAAGNGAASFVRIDAVKLDKLVNLVGELVTAGAKVASLSEEIGEDRLLESTEDMNETLEELREVALGLRMIPIGGTFNRFYRVVRDTSRELDKQIRLQVSGAETELDKTVIEKISDPLTHLIRNAMDHGIEMPEERSAVGKSPEGTITLNAYHETGSIVINIKDDGRGLDAVRIRNKAVERGLIQPDQELSDYEIYQLIFEAGFSTAEQVSNISGRGVGMDVVRRNIESLRGEIDLHSTPGEGTRFTIRLPLTLAIIDGFHIGVADEDFIIPQDMVVECVTVTPEQREATSGHDYINLRNEVLPLIALEQDLSLTVGPSEESHFQNVVVVRYGDHKAGLLVNKLFGEVQAVIKPLGRVFHGLEGFSGFTIMGSGKVSLIVDVAGLMQDVIRRHALSHSRNARAAGAGSGLASVH